MDKLIKNIINGYPNYEITTDGKVWSIRSQIYLKPKTLKDGYLGVNLYNDAKRKTFKIHRLVAEHFIPNPDNLPEVNHKDEDKTNNNIDNLEWCTHKYNANYGTKLERTSISLKKSFQEHPERKYWKGKHISESMRSALSEAAKQRTGGKNSNAKPVLCIDTNKIYPSAVDASNDLNINASSIRQCCKGKYKTAGGYRFEYIDKTKIENFIEVI